MAMPQWVVDQMQSTYDPSQMVSTGPEPLPAAFQSAPPAQPGMPALLPPEFDPGQEQLVGQQSVDPAQLQSTYEPQPLVSAQPAPLYTEYNPPAEQPEQQVSAPLEMGNLGMLAAMYARGNQRAIPERVVKAAEQWKQQGPAAIPGMEGPYAQAQAEREEAENEALLDQRMALMQQADRADEAARSEYLRGRGYADRLVQNENDQRERGALIDSRVSELDRLIEQRSSIQATNPVKDYWSSMSGWGRFATALSLGLSTLGSNLTGGENVALSMINREIDGEIQKQKVQVDLLGTTIAAKRSLLGDMLSKFRDPAAADHAARSALLGMAESQYRAQAAREKSAELKNQMTLMADQLALQRAASKEAALGGERTALWAWQPKRVVGNAGGYAGLDQYANALGLSPEQRRQMKLEFTKGGPQATDAFLSGIKSAGSTMNRNEVAQARFDMEHKIILQDGSIGYVKDKGDYEKTMTSLDTMTSNLGRLQKYVLSGSPWSPTDRANVDAVASMAMGEIRILLGLGVMSESDKELAAKLTGDFVNDRVAMADKRARLETLQSLVDQKRRFFQERVTRDPNVSEKAEPTIVTRKVR
jgi:hypothetical protein